MCVAIDTPHARFKEMDFLLVLLFFIGRHDHNASGPKHLTEGIYFYELVCNTTNWRCVCTFREGFLRR